MQNESSSSAAGGGLYPQQQQEQQQQQQQQHQQPILNRPYRISERTSTNDTQMILPASSFAPNNNNNSNSINAVGGSGSSGMTSNNATSSLMAPSTGQQDAVAADAGRKSPIVGAVPVNSSNNISSSINNNNPHGAVQKHHNNNNNIPLRQQPPHHPPLTTANHAHSTSATLATLPAHPCRNPAAEINSRLDAQVEVRVYPCNNNDAHPQKKKFTQFRVKPEGVIIQGTNRHRAAQTDLGSEYAAHVGRKLHRYELSDTRASQLLVTTHDKSFWVVPAPEAFSRHSGTCRLLGDRKHPPAAHALQVGDFLRVGSVGVVVIETHDGRENRVLSEEKIQKIMKDTTNSGGGSLDLAETEGENSDDDSSRGADAAPGDSASNSNDVPTCYMCFDEEDTPENPMITPCKCSGDTRYVHVDCLRKWHTAEADNQVCFLSSVDATCSVCKTTFRSDFKLKDGRLVKLFKSSLEPPYVSLLVATKHEMAQRLFNTRFQLSFSTLLKQDRRNGTRPLLLGRSSGSDMVLDYRTVSARHATIRFKNGEFIFTDAGSSNGSYLYLRRPVELSSSQSVQFRLGRSMISMKVVSKWNRRLLRAVSRRAGLGTSSNHSSAVRGENDDHSVGSNEDDVRITDCNGQVTRTLPRRTREDIMASMPPVGTLSQTSSQHLDLLCALAYPNKMAMRETKEAPKIAKALPPLQMVNFGEGMDDTVNAGARDAVHTVVQQREELPDVSGPILDVSGSLNDMEIKEEDEEQH